MHIIVTLALYRFEWVHVRVSFCLTNDNGQAKDKFIDTKNIKTSHSPPPKTNLQGPMKIFVTIVRTAQLKKKHSQSGENLLVFLKL